MYLMTGLAFLLSSTTTVEDLGGGPASTMVELAVGYRVVNREIEPVMADHVFMAGESVVVWTRLSGVKGAFVQHVWWRDGVEVARHFLPVASERRWRTWSRQRVQPGSYQVQVIDADDAVLGDTTFDVIDEDD